LFLKYRPVPNFQYQYQKFSYKTQHAGARPMAKSKNQWFRNEVSHARDLIKLAKTISISIVNESLFNRNHHFLTRIFIV